MQQKSSLYLWDLRTLYIGEAFDLTCITPAASILVYCIEGSMIITEKRSGKVIVTRSALIPAGKTFDGVAGSENIKVSICFLDPFGTDFEHCKHFMKSFSGGIYFDSNDEARQIQLFEEIYLNRLAEDEAYHKIVEQLFHCSEVVSQQPQVDERIATVVGFIKSNFSENHSNQYLADLVGMSDVNLRRTFKKILKIPIRRYRLWHRLFITANLMVLGCTLTEASIAAGFSDSSHFNHVFRSMLGINPSYVLKRAHNTCLFAPSINNRLISELLNLPALNEIDV